MSEQIWWFVARSGGLVAWGLLAVSMCFGLLVSTRAANTAASPPSVLGMHRFWSLLAIVFTGVHVAGLVADSYVEFGWSETLVPWASEWKPTAVAWGVIAMYLLIAIELTSLIMKRLPRPLWAAIHRISFALFVFATLHGIQAGTDIGNTIYQLALLAAINIVAFLTVLTLMAKARKRERKQPATASA